MGSAGRRIVTTTSAQAMGRSGAVLRGRGIRRVVTAGPSATTSTEDLPTVQLCDLPSNLTLSDINQIVADAGVGQPVVSTPLFYLILEGQGSCDSRGIIISIYLCDIFTFIIFRHY